MAQNNDLLNEFADISAAAQQFDYLEKRLEAYVSQMERASKAGKIAFDGLEATKTLTELGKNATTAAESSKKAAVAVKDYTQAVEDAEVFLSKLSDSMRENVKLEVMLEKQLADVKKQMKELKADAGDYSVILEKLTAEEVGLKVALSEVRIALKQEEKQMQASAGSVDEMSVKVGRLKDAWRQLDAQERNSEGGMKLLYEIQGLDEAVKAANASIGNFQGNVGNYPNAAAELREIRDELIKLKLAGHDSGEEFEALTGRAKQLGMAINEVGKLTQSTGGTTATTTGNFQKAANAAYSFQQVLRETPSAAYSFSTYMSAISNNLPILIQHLQELKAANIAAKAAGEATIPTWKVLAQSLFSLNGIATLAVAAFTIFTARSSMAGNAMNETDKAAQSLNKSMIELNETIKQSYDSEIAKTADLLRVAKSLEEPYRARIDAIQELIRLYPALLQSIDQEAFLLGKTGNIQEVLDKVVDQQQHIKRVEEEMNLIVKQRTDALVKLNEAQKDEGNSITDIFNWATGKDPFKEQKESIEGYTKRIADLKDLSRILKEELQFMLNPTHQGRILSDIDGDIKKFQALRDANAANTAEHKRAIAELKKLEEERRKFLDKPQKKGPKDNSLKYEQDYTKELYSEYAKRLQIEAEYYKVIYENDKLSMQERIAAYTQYQDLMFQAQAEGLSAQYDMTQLALNRIAAIEKKSAADRTDQEKDLLAQKAVLQARFNNISAEYDLLREEHINKTAKGIIAIQDDEVTKRLDSIKLLNNNVEIEEAQAQQALAAQLQEGSIKYRDYIKLRRDLDNKYQREKQVQTIDYLQEELETLSKQGVDVTKLQEALNEAKKRLYDADLQAFVDNERKKAEANKELNSRIAQLGMEVVSAAHTLVTAYYDREISQLERKGNLIRSNAQAEIDAINGSMESESKKRARIAAVNMKAAEEERKIEKEKAAINRKKAIADRIAALANIAQSQAQAQAQALTYLSNPVTAPAYPAIATLIGTIGAVQAAAVLATPIPEYWKGTPIGGHPADGPARIGEREPEVVIEPGQEPYVVESEQVRYLPKGTHVLNRKMLERDTATMGALSPRQLGQLELEQAGGVTLQFAADVDRIVSSQEHQGKEIRQAIANMPRDKWIVRNGDLLRINQSGVRITKYINREN